MKNRIWCLLLVCLLGSCSKGVDPKDCDLNTNYVKSVSQAEKWIVGEWKLVGVTSMSYQPPNSPVKIAQLRLRFTKQGEVATIRNDTLVETNRYSIMVNQSELILKTDAQPKSGNWYVRNPTLRLCSEKMFLDAGIAFDAPGFTFQRSNQ